MSIYGMRTSALGAMGQDVKLALISNNIANSNTTGYKPDRISFNERLVEALEDFPDKKYYNGIIHKYGGAPFIDKTEIKIDQGSIHQTGNMFDFAINGEGFFAVVDSKTKERFLTRNGSFMIDELGNLKTQDGRFEVLNFDLAPITVDIDQPLKVTVSDQGEIYQNQAFIGNLGVFNPKNMENARKVGHNLFSTDAQGFDVAEGYKIYQGSLEGSAVSSITEMTEMIKTVRNIETNLRMITLQDGSLDRLINGVARA